MDTALTAVRHEADPQAVRQWAAEDFAIALGLLRECPYHGEPYKASNRRFARTALASRSIDPLDPVVRVFNGNTRELMAAVERVTRGYGDRCPHCQAFEDEEFD
jgi:hypothetical protein